MMNKFLPYLAAAVFFALLPVSLLSAQQTLAWGKEISNGNPSFTGKFRQDNLQVGDCLLRKMETDYTITIYDDRASFLLIFSWVRDPGTGVDCLSQMSAYEPFELSLELKDHSGGGKSVRIEDYFQDGFYFEKEKSQLRISFDYARDQLDFDPAITALEIEPLFRRASHRVTVPATAVSTLFYPDRPRITSREGITILAAELSGFRPKYPVKDRKTYRVRVAHFPGDTRSLADFAKEKSNYLLRLPVPLIGNQILSSESGNWKGNLFLDFISYHEYDKKETSHQVSLTRFVDLRAEGKLVFFLELLSAGDETLKKKNLPKLMEYYRNNLAQIGYFLEGVIFE